MIFGNFLKLCYSIICFIGFSKMFCEHVVSLFSEIIHCYFYIRSFSLSIANTLKHNSLTNNSPKNWNIFKIIFSLMYSSIVKLRFISKINKIRGISVFFCKKKVIFCRRCKFSVFAFYCNKIPQNLTLILNTQIKWEK